MGTRRLAVRWRRFELGAAAMLLVVWKEEFRVGVPAFDDDHQGLLDIIKIRYDQAEAGAGQGREPRAIA